MMFIGSMKFSSDNIDEIQVEMMPLYDLHQDNVNFYWNI